MGMLTGSEIIKMYNDKKLFISEFDEARVNPNSYNVRLDDTILTYVDGIILDPKIDNPVDTHIISAEYGMLLEPGKLYLGSTKEHTSTDHFIPCIDGRSSIARLGLKIHETAGFGDIGFSGRWTLEITVTHPIRVYPNMEIGQVYFTTPVGETDIKYNGKYQNAEGVIKSHMYEDRYWNK